MDDDNLSDMSSDLSSDLSSPRSLSPPQLSPSPFMVPLDYPSPVSSQEQDASSSADQSRSKKRALEDEGAPVAKKRRTVEPKPRTTEYLDLNMPTSQCATDQKNQLDILMKVLRKRRKIVVIAGAGISVSAGIPDFRSSTGLFTTLRSEHKLKASGKYLFDASVYQTDSSTSSFHDMVRSLSHLVSAAEPTAFHQMLSTLGSEGRLLRLYTQNVDGIDVALPSLETSVPLSSKGPWPRTIQLHGGLEKMVCSKCSHLSDFQPALFDGPEPPLCRVCIETDKVRTDHAGKRSHGIGKLRPRIVLYNEHNPDEEAIGAVVSSDLRARPDAVIVVGTSMKIPGVRRIVREMCGVVRGRRDGLAVWINRDPPPLGKEFEDCWDLVVKGPSDKVAQQWIDVNKGYMDCTDSEVERAKARAGDVQVIINSQHEKVVSHGMLTPGASPGPVPNKIMMKIKVPAGLKKDFKFKVDQKSTGQAATSIPNPANASKAPTKSSKAVPKPSTTTVAKKPRKKLPPSKPKPGPAGIQKMFKTTKASIKAPKKPTRKSRKSSLDELAALPSPMLPISPTGARNNGPINKTPVKSHDTSHFSNLTSPGKSMVVEIPRGSPYQVRETVSPTGSIPKDMARLGLLN
ncbi:hypothetical protein MMC30_008893 [Trapelia coarctata]|nr:hypothetical protein [Trapelia coarctata]